MLSNGRLETIAAKGSLAKGSPANTTYYTTPWTCFDSNVEQLHTGQSYVYVATRVEHFVFDLAGRLLLTVPRDSRLRFVCFTNGRVVFVREHADLGIIPTIVSYALCTAALSPCVGAVVDVPEQIASRPDWFANLKVWFVASNTWWFADGHHLVAVHNGYTYACQLTGRILGFSNHHELKHRGAVIATVVDPLDETLQLTICTLTLSADGTGSLRVGPNMTILSEGGVRLQALPFAGVISIVHRDGMVAWVRRAGNIDTVHALLFHGALCAVMTWSHNDHCLENVCDIMCTNETDCEVSCVGDKWGGRLCLTLGMNSSGQREVTACLERTDGRDDNGSDVRFDMYTSLTVGPVVSLAVACVGATMVDHVDALAKEMNDKYTFEMRAGKAKQHELEATAAELKALQDKFDKHTAATGKLVGGMRQKIEHAALAQTIAETEAVEALAKAAAAYNNGYAAAKLEMNETADASRRIWAAELKQLRSEVASLKSQLAVKQTALDNSRKAEQQSLQQFKQQLDDLTQRYEADAATQRQQLHAVETELKTAKAQAADITEKCAQAAAAATREAEAKHKQALQAASAAAVRVATDERKAAIAEERRKAADEQKKAVDKAARDARAAMAAATKTAEERAHTAEAVLQSTNIEASMARLAAVEAERKLQHWQAEADDKASQAEAAAAKQAARIAELEQDKTELSHALAQAKTELAKAVEARRATELERVVTAATPPPSPPGHEVTLVLHETNAVLVSQVKATQEQMTFLHEQLRVCNQDKVSALADVRASSARISALEGEIARLQQELGVAVQNSHAYYQSMLEMKTAYDQYVYASRQQQQRRLVKPIV